jgi:hypothetical protein
VALELFILFVFITRVGFGALDYVCEKFLLKVVANKSVVVIIMFCYNELVNMWATEIICMLCTMYLFAGLV